MPTPPAAADADAPASYEAAVAELDRLVQQMETGQLPLDQLIDSYRRSGELLAWCRERLQAVEQQVLLLDGERLDPWTPSP
ncbi:MAG: exodeoxyribonuclease VII small subunit [Rubrivivax sp.]|jgi:exodeoxyribonuclease VII small subunit|nr:exodeoxyribonuclease VII small subunit [Rubrivivax sp.]